ncbi:unnamed protein product [Cochlearia groenlandica]
MSLAACLFRIDFKQMQDKRKGAFNYPTYLPESAIACPSQSLKGSVVAVAYDERERASEREKRGFPRISLNLSGRDKSIPFPSDSLSLGDYKGFIQASRSLT